MLDASTGGNDNLTVDGNYSTLYGDARYIVGGQPGDDTLAVTGYSNHLYGDANQAHATQDLGDDSLTATGDENILYGDAYAGSGTRFGDDTLTAAGNNNFLYGDAIESYGSIGGNDTLVATGQGNVLFGDSVLMLDGSIGGADTFVFGPDSGTATIADFRSSDGDKIDLTAVLDAPGQPLSFDDLVFEVGDFSSSGIAGDDTRVYLGVEVGQTTSDNYITVAGVTGLLASDFDFYGIA